MDKIKPKTFEHKQRTSGAKFIPAFYFSFLTPFYDFMMRLGARESTFKPRLVEQVKIEKNQRVLDLGCGTGTLTVLLKKSQPEAEVIGYDADPKVLEIAKAKADQAGLNLSFDKGMSYELPYSDNSFDRVVASMVFHHLSVKNKASTLKEIFRVLKPEGEFHVVDFGKPQNIVMRVSSLVTRNLEETADLIRGSLPLMLNDAGLENIEQTGQFMTFFGTFNMYKAQKSTKPSSNASRMKRNEGISTENQNHRTKVERVEYYSLLKNYARVIAPFYNVILKSLTFGLDLRLRHQVVNFAEAPFGSKVLDIATGTGKQAFAFAEKSYDVVGVDLSKDMLKIAKKNNRFRNLKFDLTDAANLPFEDNSFDVSCVSFALHDMIPIIREKALKEMARVTKKDGAIMIIDYALPKNKIRRFFFYNFIRLYEPYYKEFIKSDLETLLKKSGIQIDEELSVLFGAGRILKGTKLRGD